MRAIAQEFRDKESDPARQWFFDAFVPDHVRMDDGAYRTISQSHVPAVAAGDKVKVVNGTVSAIP